MMAGFLDSYELAKPPAAPAPPPGAPASFLDAYEIAPAPNAPRAAEGLIEHAEAGYQASAIGLALRGKLPDLVMNPESATWLERLTTGVTGVGMDLPIMIPAGAAGAAAGTASAGPVGGILAGGAAMFAAPAGIKTSLMEVYKAGAGETPADWFNIVREVAKSMVREGAIGAVTFGAGAVARGGAAAVMGASGQAATAVGLGTATMATKGASKIAGTADVAAQIAAMVTMPAALEGRLPEKREFLDAAAVILTLKGAHVALENAGVLRTTAQRIANVYERTGKTPAEQLADAQADPNVANELTRAANQEATGTTSGVPLKLDRLVAEAQFLARGGVPEAPNIKAIIKEIKEAGPLQGDMVRDLDRLDTLSGRQELTAEERVELETLAGKIKADAATQAEIEATADRAALKDLLVARLRTLEEKFSGTEDQTITDPEGVKRVIPGKQAEFMPPEEKAERDWLRENIDNPEAIAARYRLVKPTPKADVPRETPAGPPPGPRFAPDQLIEAAERARTRLEELTEKATREALTDAERAERIGLTNAMGNPEALAKRFGIEPSIKPITDADRQASAQRVYDDVLRQAQENNAARQAAGLEPLGDEHALAVATLMRARILARATRLGVLPEDLYNERPLQIRDETQAGGAAAEAEPPPVAPPDAPRFVPPEVDLFGNPILPEVLPRLAEEGLATVEVPLANLRLSKEVPQFKKDANAAGVIVPLGGKFDRTGVGPIQVWERLDGSMEVISGRHRLDLARRSGEETIPAQIHREADGYTARQAATLDAQLNIREEQGSVADYAQYFHDSAIPESTANELGLLARAKGRSGFAIARNATSDTMAAHRAGLLSDDAALVISTTAPGSERLQALGIAVVNEGKSALFAANMMKSVDMMAAERQAAGAQGDIFGFDDSAMREAAAMAKKASSAQRKISEQISAVSGASRRPEIARKLGVDVQDPEGVQKKIAELKQEQYRWDNWPLYPELVAKLRGQELKQSKLLEGEEQWYHGTREDIANFTRGGEVYLVDRPVEAAGYALGGHLGGTGAEQPRVYSIAAKKGKTLNIDDMIAEEIMNGAGEIEVALDAGIAKAKAEGARYVEYEHPSFEGDAEQNVRISLYPAEDLRITHKPTKDRGGVLFQDELELKPETPAELKARDAEAVAAAKRKLAQDRAGVKGPVPTVDQADLFNTQRTLFQPAYHGSPHVFDQFQLQKIGTGEGAQVYGWGLYFSSVKKIAEWYRDNLTTPDPQATRVVFGSVPDERYAPYVVLSEQAKKDVKEALASQGWDIREAARKWPEITLRMARNPKLSTTMRSGKEAGEFLKNEAAEGNAARPDYQGNYESGWLAPNVNPERMTSEERSAFYDMTGSAYWTKDPKQVVPRLRSDAEKTITAQQSWIDSYEKDLSTSEDPSYRTMITKSLQEAKDTLANAQVKLQVLDKYDVRWEVPKKDKAGRVYKVDIPEDDTMLDYDKPIAEQPEPVKAALAAIVDQLRPPADEKWGKLGDPAQFETLTTGQGIYRAIQDMALRYDGNPVNEIFKSMGPEARQQEAASRYLAELGVTGITYKGHASGEKNFVVFDDKAIKILEHYQDPTQERGDQHLGSYSIAENLITTFRNANKSTIVHELSHSWLEEMKADAARPDAPAQIKADWDMIRREFAIGENGEISTASHEQFARTGERYLGEGKAPSIGLRAVFEQFKAWMLQIYSNLQNLGVNINPEVRGLFDRMLATDQEIADARAMDVPRAYVPEARAAAAERIVPPAPEGRKIEPGFEAEKASMEPYADELPPGPGTAPASSHVNYAYMNSAMDVKLALQRMAEIDQANIQKHRGGKAGVESWAEEQATMERHLLDTLGGGPDNLGVLRGGMNPNDPKINHRLRAMNQLMEGAARDSARLRDVVLEAGHDATVRQQLEYMGALERGRMLQAEFLGERAAVARAMNALKDVTEGSGEIAKMLDVIGYGEAAARELFQAARTPAEEQAYMRLKLDEILQNYKGKSVLEIAKLHKEIGTLKGTFKFSKAVTAATKWEMVVEGWRSSILSGPVTHTTNLFGTEGFHFLRPAVDALAATIGMARGASPGMGESDRASMSEAVARIGGMISGIKDGVKVAVATFKLDDPTGKTEAYRTAIPGRFGEIWRIPLRMMGAEDALVSTMYKRGELATLAIRQAFDEQMNPSTREFAERVSYLKEHPTPEMEAAADAASTRMTFNAPLGEKGVALQLFVNKWNLQWMIPFIRTPINITKEVARMSPLAPLVGEWRAAIAKGGVERDRALAELAIGTGIMALAMSMTFDETLSGAGSPDPGKNRGKVGVWQPYSRLIGDTWYEYARIQPVGTLVGMAADVATIWDHMNDEEKDKIPKLLAVAFSNAVTNQTFLQGITNVINAMSEPTRFLPRFANQMAGSMVPNIIAQPTAMADPVVREVNGMLEAIQARIPGMRQDLMPKLDWLGEPVETKERVAGVMPVRTLKVSEDKVRLEAARLELSLAAAPKKTHIGKGTGKLGDVELTPEERNTFAKVGGEFAHQILDNIVNAPGYENIPDLVKRKIFRDVIAKSHQLAAAAALPIDKRLAYIQSITERVTAELQPSEAQ